MADLHDGHRMRMFEKLQNTPQTLCDHELLEILLFFVLPRVNTNPIAHELLERFGSLDAVFKADERQLTNVSGIGKQAANYLITVGTLMKRIKETKSDAPRIFNSLSFSNYVKEKYRNLQKEVFDIYFVDKAYSMKGSYRMSSDLIDRVDILPKELMNVISATNADGIFLVHNHINAPAIPSRADDDLTQQVDIIASMCNIRLYDHIIYSDLGEPYSYHASGRLDDNGKYHFDLFRKF